MNDLSERLVSPTQLETSRDGLEGLRRLVEASLGLRELTFGQGDPSRARWARALAPG